MPIFYRMSYVKFIMTSNPTDFDNFFHDYVLQYQYQVILNELSIAVMIIANIPEIVVKIMMYLSIPMFERLKITFNLYYLFFPQTLISLLGFCWGIVKFMNFERRGNI